MFENAFKMFELNLLTQKFHYRTIQEKYNKIQVLNRTINIKFLKLFA